MFVAGRFGPLSQVVLQRFHEQFLMVFLHFEALSTFVLGHFSPVDVAGFHCCIVCFLTLSTSFWRAGTLTANMIYLKREVLSKKSWSQQSKGQEEGSMNMPTLMERSGGENASGTVAQRPKKVFFKFSFQPLIGIGTPLEYSII